MKKYDQYQLCEGFCGTVHTEYYRDNDIGMTINFCASMFSIDDPKILEYFEVERFNRLTEEYYVCKISIREPKYVPYTIGPHDTANMKEVKTLSLLELRRLQELLDKPVNRLGAEMTVWKSMISRLNEEYEITRVPKRIPTDIPKPAYSHLVIGEYVKIPIWKKTNPLKRKIMWIYYKLKAILREKGNCNSAATGS